MLGAWGRGWLVWRALEAVEKVVTANLAFNLAFEPRHPRCTRSTHERYMSCAYGTASVSSWCGTRDDREEVTMKTEDGVQNLVRLSVNLSPTVFGELKDYADRKGVSVTEAVRRAISVLKYVDEAQERGASLNIEENGTLKEVQFML
jgi:hypothetical protein